MRNAQDEAFARLALEQGLLSRGSLPPWAELRAPLAQEVVTRNLLSPRVAEGLLDALRVSSFVCRGCRAALDYGGLGSLPSLRCARCKGTLERSRGMESTQVQRRIGPYVLLEEIGQGAAGVVYKARHRDLAGECALKVITGIGADEETLSRFQLEANVASRLTHPGVVRVHDLGRQGDHYYYAMEYCRGPSLEQRLRAERLPTDEAARIVLDLARTLSFAHEQGVIHRDVKPANVILDEGAGGRPRITDFGLARDRNLVNSMTRTGDILGTPYYMAPEQFRGERDLDHRVDVYALLILYQALSGSLPYVAENAAELMRKVCRGRARPLRTLLPNAPQRLEEICALAMAVDVEDRYRTAGELADALDDFLTSGSQGRAEESVEIVGPAQRDWKPLAMVGAALGLGLLTVLFMALAADPTPVVAAKPDPIEAANVAGDPAEKLKAGTVSAPPPKAPLPEPPPPVSPPLPEPAREEASADLDAEAAALLELIEPVFGGDRFARTQLLEGSAEAYRKHPRDSRVLFAYAIGLVAQGRIHDGRRLLVRAARAEPPLSPGLRDRAGRFCHMLGFERAAADLAEVEFREGASPAPEHGVFLVQLYLKARAPVADPDRALVLCERLLKKKDQVNAMSYPKTAMLHVHLADAHAGLGNAESAASAFERAAELASGREARHLRASADRCRSEGVRPELMGRKILLQFAVGPFLHQIDSLDRVADRGSDLEAAAGFEQAAERHGGEERATALLRAARSYQLGGNFRRAIRALQLAVALDLPARALDTRALVQRTLARHLLASAEPSHVAEARRLAALAAAPSADPGEAPLTPGELADALTLEARALLALGKVEEARAALAKAEALGPRDRRELEATKRSLP